MEFRILGSLSVVDDDDQPRSIGGRKERALLALLLVNANRVVSLDRIVDELWGDDPPVSAVRTLRSHTSRLRRQLASSTVIETRDSGYVLVAAPSDIDATRFEHQLESGIAHQRAGAHGRASADLAAALAEWQGTALAGLEDHDFAQLESARLEARRLEAIEARISSDLELGRHRQLVAELEKLVATQPLREGLWRYLMLALYRSGRQADALRTYQEAARRLGEELGIEPSPELRDLEEMILLQDDKLTAVSETLGANHNLPTARDSFIGREKELAELRRLIRDYRCVTLTGVGGSGKTRLAIEAARASVASYPDGAKYVELAALTSPDELVQQVLLSFGEPGSHSGDAAVVLSEYIGGKHFLLILDNCEHLVASAAELADQLLDRCPNLSILATSREDLAISGEAVFRVPALSVPGAKDEPEAVRATEAARLLTDRVRAYRQSFAIDDDNVEAVAMVCRKLDGIPLAIELASARMSTMFIGELADRIDDRLSLLTKGTRTAPPRQQTLRATIEWSHDLLSVDARQLFRTMGVFSGSWTLEAVQAVAATREPAAATVDLLGELVEKSLVERTLDGRYRLLETIREFAFEQLVISGEAPQTALRHRDWFLQVARQEDAGMRRRDQQEAWTRLEKDHDNLRAALRWSLSSGDANGALQLIAALAGFWMVRGYWGEAWRWFGRCIAEEGSSPLIRARAIAAQALTEVIRVNYKAVEELLEEAKATFKEIEDEAGLGGVAFLQAVSATFRGAANATHLLRAAYDEFLRLDDSWSAAFAARYLGAGAEDAAEAVPLLMESYERFNTLGDRWNAAFSMYYLSGWYLDAERFSDAIEAAEEARNLASAIDDVVWYAHSNRNLGLAAYMLGDHQRAREIMTEALDRFRLMGDDACTVTLGTYLSAIDVAANEPADALAHTVATMRAALRMAPTPGGGVGLWHAADVAVALGDHEQGARLAAIAKAFLASGDYHIGGLVDSDIAAIDGRIAAAVDPDRRLAIATAAAESTLVEGIEEALEWALARTDA